MPRERRCGRQLPIDAIGFLYSSPVKVDEEGRYIAHLRTKIALGAAEGFERRLTNITEKQDVDFQQFHRTLEELLDDDRVRGEDRRKVRSVHAGEDADLQREGRAGF